MDGDIEYRRICSRLTLQSKKEGSFNGLVERLTPLTNIALFAQCRSDLDRIRFCAPSFWDLIGAEMIFKGKNAEEALAKRLEGNTAFEKGELQKALLFYSQSLARAPVGIDLAHVYSNRSALFHKMGESQLSINDAELAIAYGSPDNTKHKLYERMAACYFTLKNYPKMRISINVAKHLAQQHDPKNEKFFKKLSKLSESLVKVTGDVKSTGKSEKLAHEDEDALKTNAKFPGTIDQFDVQFQPQLGRFAYAKEKIELGKVILREKPFASCLFPERMGTHCLHCFKRLKAPIPCEVCANVIFCSRECRQEAKAYHQYECRILALLIGSGMSINCHLAFRIITQNTAKTLLETSPNLQPEDDKVVLSSEGKYDPKSYLSVYNLGGMERMRHPQELLDRTIMALFLMKCLRIVGYFNVNLFLNPHPTEEEIQIGALILRNLQVMPFNAYIACEFLMDSKENFRKSKSFDLGLAIYPTAAFLNHSCTPDVARYFDGTTLIIETIKEIKPGQAIHDNYGPLASKMTMEERQKKLNGRYWFTCNCLACEEKWPMTIELPDEIQPMTPVDSKIYKKLIVLDLQFHKAFELMNTGRGIPASELFKIYLKESRLLISLGSKDLQPYKTIQLAEEALKLCLCTKGSVHV